MEMPSVYVCRSCGLDREEWVRAWPGGMIESLTRCPRCGDALALFQETKVDEKEDEKVANTIRSITLVKYRGKTREVLVETSDGANELQHYAVSEAEEAELVGLKPRDSHRTKIKKYIVRMVNPMDVLLTRE